jgi:hypothetical protein
MQNQINNYEKVIAKAIASGTLNMVPAGSVMMIHCYHDENCGINKGKACDCNVEVVLEVKPVDKKNTAKRTKHPPHTELENYQRN